MSIDGKHFYRFKYLRSDHWQNLRLDKLVEVDARCEKCGLRDLSNDVHHLNYRKLYDVTLPDLVVLCRACHDLVHEALEKHRDFIKVKGEDVTWRRTRQAAIATERGMASPENHEFRKWRRDHREDRLREKLKEAWERDRENREAKEERARVEYARTMANLAIRQSRPDGVTEKMRQGFGGESTKQLFIELRKVRFWDCVWQSEY